MIGRCVSVEFSRARKVLLKIICLCSNVLEILSIAYLIIGQDLVKHQRIIMLSVGASNPAHLRCRYCGPEKDGCSKELPACARCRAKGQLCIYPLRPDVHKETERQKQKSELNSF